MDISQAAKTVQVVREVAASPDKIWSMITDLPRMGEWSPENKGGEWIKGAVGAAIGSKFKGRNESGKKSWGSIVEVTQFKPPEVFAFALKAFGKNWADWIWEIAPTAKGSKITHSWVDNRGWIAVLLGRLVSGIADRGEHNRSNMEKTLDTLVKALVK